MNLRRAWIIARKDIDTFRTKRSILYSVVLLPVIVSVGLPLLIHYSTTTNGGSGIPAAEIPVLLDAFAFFFVIIAAIIPTAIASYAIVGEKVQKSLEPLLATPTSDSEILLGKSLAAFLPSIGATWAGGVIFMLLMDWFTVGNLGYNYYPSWAMAAGLLVAVPLASVLSIELSVIVSSRVNDVRTAQQLGSLMVIPFAGIYVGGELSLIALDLNTLLEISAVIALFDVALFFLARATFRREEILTKWK